MKNNRIYNFSAGPAMLPEEVLETAASEMLDYKGSGMSVMEMSHRSKVYQNIIDEAEKDLRALIGIPENYKVLFLQGGATLQFALIPLNFMVNGKADYINTGVWTKKAIKDAKLFGEVNVIASGEGDNFKTIPDVKNLKYDAALIMFICVITTLFMVPNLKNIHKLQVFL